MKMEVTNLLCGLYVLLTVVKISQLLMTVIGRKIATKKHNHVEYSPSLQALMFFLDYVLFRHEKNISMMPRKVFREITDPWVDDYVKRVNQNKGIKTRVFKSLREARNVFYMEFCQVPSSFMVHWIANSSSAFITQPLGLHSVIAIFYWVALSPFMLLQERLSGGNSFTFNCKMAASSTVNEVYVVCCKEQIPFEVALAKYPWVTGLFSRKQVHAMIGRAVCPLYKREFPFPVKEDIMDFDYEVLDAGVARLKQRHDSFWANLVEGLYPSHFVLAALFLCQSYFDFLQGGELPFSWLWKVAPYAAAYYPVRVFVDWQLGIKWHPDFYYFI